MYLNDYDDIMDGRAQMGNFIVQAHNQERPEAEFGYSTPIEFEQQYLS